MSMSVDGVWKAGVWATTVWANGVWFEGAYVPPAVAEEPNNLSGGKPEKKKKRRKSLYDDVENNARFVVPTSFETAESVPLEAIPESADTSKPVSVDGLSAMSEAFQKAGIRTSEQFIQKQESIDRRRKLNLAAIILLLD